MKAENDKNSTYGLIIPVEQKQLKNRVFYAVVFAFVFCVACFCLLPPLWILLSSFKSTEEFISVPPTLFPKHINLHKIVDVWEMTNFGPAYLSSVCLAIGQVTSCLLFNGLAGYVISRLKPKGIAVFGTMVMITMMMPGGISMVPLFMTFIDFPIFHWNMSDSFTPMWLMAGANAFDVLLFKSFFDSISKSYMEAARIDGCGNMGIFIKIILPMSKPIFVTVAISSFNGAWGNFFWPYLLIKDAKKIPVSLLIYNLKGVAAEDIYMMALIFVIIVPAIVFLLFQKHIMEGFTLGGIKE